MPEDQELRQIRDDWIGRQREHGNLPRAVLMKGLHPLINDTIDLWHRLVMRAAFGGQTTQAPCMPSLDVGCGYGRLANEAKACGLTPICGIDFTEQFCIDFQRCHGPAVCGELSRLPFSDAVFRHAYAVTALMYLSVGDAHKALVELDRCVVGGSRVLLIEPCREFNSLVRVVLRRKAKESLSRPGFSMAEICDELPPHSWRRLGAGSCPWTTALLPALIFAARVPVIYRVLSRLVLRLDRPSAVPRWRPGKFSMYRWAIYQKAGGELDVDKSGN